MATYCHDCLLGSDLGPQATALSGNSEPRQPHQACQETGWHFPPCMAWASVTPFRSPFVTPETQPAHRGAVTERGPHTTGLAGPFLFQEKIPISPSLDQESVNRPAAVGLETTAPPPSVIRIQQGLGLARRQPRGAGVLD